MSVTAATGFAAAGVHAGIRRKGLDLAVVRSTTPAVGAAMFTVNQVLAAPTAGTVERTTARSSPLRRMPAATPEATKPLAAVTLIPALPRA